MMIRRSLLVFLLWVMWVPHTWAADDSSQKTIPTHCNKSGNEINALSNEQYQECLQLLYGRYTEFLSKYQERYNSAATEPQMLNVKSGVNATEPQMHGVHYTPTEPQMRNLRRTVNDPQTLVDTEPQM